MAERMQQQRRFIRGLKVATQERLRQEEQQLVICVSCGKASHPNAYFWAYPKNRNHGCYLRQKQQRQEQQLREQVRRELREITRNTEAEQCSHPAVLLKLRITG